MAEIHRKVDATSYHGGEIFTPFSGVGQMYDLPIGKWRLKAYQYRVLTFVFLGVGFLLSLYFLLLSQMPREQVFAVQVLNTGFSTGVTELSIGSYSSSNSFKILKTDKTDDKAPLKKGVTS